MTCIVGFTDGKNVWMGGDSASVGGYSLSECTVPKVFKKSGLIIGYTTSWRMGQILIYDTIFPPINRGMDLMEYMVSRFVPKIKKTFIKQGFDTSDSKGDNSDSGGNFLVGVRKRLFEVQGDFAVLEHPYGFESVGCGFEIAKGAMYANKHLKDPEKRIINALEAASEFSAGVRGPHKVFKL